MFVGCNWRVLAFALALLCWPPRGKCGPRYSSRIVDTAAGAVRGIITEPASRHLEPVEVFRGVPYAAPPVGPLRFRPPQPPSRWPGTRLAETFGTVCPQTLPDISNRTAALLHMPRARYNYLKKLIPLLLNQSEDCLLLNIYIPGSGNRGLEAPYAVIFFIHGESFEWGSGNPYDGSVLSSYGHVIVITVNYRLGILGFLRTTTVGSVNDLNSGSDGGLAVRDLVAALRWVRANIGAFGGDATRVTLLGHGTGAALANLLLIMPSAKGLFHRVVLMSGTALSPWASLTNPDNLRKTVGEQTGCLPSESEDDIAGCLRSVPLAELMSINVPRPRFMSAWAPSLGQEAILTMERLSDTFITCELMLSTTSTESYIDFNAADIQYGFEEEQRNRILRTYIRNAYVYHLNEIFSAVRNEYTDWDKSIQHPINIRDSTMEALSDGHTVAPLLRVAYQHSRRGAVTYFAHFAYQTKDGDFPQRLGSVRGEDLTYVFGSPLVNGEPNFPHNFSRQDVTVAETVLNLFTNFAKSGDPNEPRPQKPDHGITYVNRDKSKHRALTWETYETGTQSYLSISAKPKMKSHYRGHKIALWLNLIPQLHQPGDDDVNMRHHHFHERDPHFYAGSIRPESMTRIPPALHPAFMTDSYIITSSTSLSPSSSSSVEGSTECLTSESTTEEKFEEQIAIVASETEGNEMLQHLTTRQYYSYTAALGVTVGVGCLLLVLNMLIFAGIYYQRDRDRKRRQSASIAAASPSPEDMIPMATRPQQSNGDSVKQKPPPPKPPVRTSSNPTPTPVTNVKKRVQIQEISL